MRTPVWIAWIVLAAVTLAIAWRVSRPRPGR
jgi:hypothetical protein